MNAVQGNSQGSSVSRYGDGGPAALFYRITFENFPDE
jgi:hypothetical protein